MEKKNKFSSSFGFVMAAAASAVGLGNIWRFPYLAAKDGGGLFLLVYIVLAFTFGSMMLYAEIAIGRKTGESSLFAYGKVNKKFGWLGAVSVAVPALILTYYCVIGGWLIKYLCSMVFADLKELVENDYFDNYITEPVWPIVFMLIFAIVALYFVLKGVNAGVEKISTIMMPTLLVLLLFVSIYSLTLNFSDGETTRTGVEGFFVYIIPDFSNITLSKLCTTIVDAMGQQFYSLSLAMGIMVSYGSYMRKEDNMNTNVLKMDICDTLVAFLAGVAIIPAVYTFAGREGLGASGPGLLFKGMTKVFISMGNMGRVMGIVFFLLVLFAALTSAISMFEAVVSPVSRWRKWTRKKTVIISGAVILIGGIFICLGYNALYFEAVLPNGVKGQILDVVDYISNNIFMPVLELFTCIMIGWVVKPKYVFEEITINGVVFRKKFFFSLFIKFVTPVFLLVLLFQSFGFVSI